MGHHHRNVGSRLALHSVPLFLSHIPVFVLIADLLAFSSSSHSPFGINQLKRSTIILYLKRNENGGNWVCDSAPTTIVDEGEKGQQGCIRGSLHPAREADYLDLGHLAQPLSSDRQYISYPGPRTISRLHKDPWQRVVPVSHPTV